jgi:hypothetical protein
MHLSPHDLDIPFLFCLMFNQTSSLSCRKRPTLPRHSDVRRATVTVSCMYTSRYNPPLLSLPGDYSYPIVPFTLPPRENPAPLLSSRAAHFTSAPLLAP